MLPGSIPQHSHAGMQVDTAYIHSKRAIRYLNVNLYVTTRSTYCLVAFLEKQVYT